ncbi:site-specific integrase [Clostridia bacterium]|nr:site-specific integrase [Clostridia bacterium]
MVDGKRKYESFTAETRREAEKQAADFAAERERAGMLRDRPEKLTVAEALTKYIDDRDNVLSPSTLRVYEGYSRNSNGSIASCQLGEITQDEIQRWINALAAEHKPKTVRNAFGLLSAVMRVYVPSWQIRVHLPRVDREPPSIPEPTDVNKIMSTIHDIKTYAALLLAAECGLRRSEVGMLEWDRIDLVGAKMYINKALVYGRHGKWVIKGTKSRKGTRWVDIPPPVVEALSSLPRDNPRVFHPMSPGAISQRIKHVIDSLGMTYTMHRMRHYHASIMNALGVPDKYAAEQLGHADTRITRDVYQHTMQSKRTEMADLIGKFYAMQNVVQNADGKTEE